ncbi:MAG: hypothetical protein ABSE73_01965 [Planctomycetota bacterium]
MQFLDERLRQERHAVALLSVPRWQDDTATGGIQIAHLGTEYRPRPVAGQEQGLEDKACREVASKQRVQFIGSGKHIQHFVRQERAPVPRLTGAWYLLPCGQRMMRQ